MGILHACGLLVRQLRRNMEAGRTVEPSGENPPEIEPQDCRQIEVCQLRTQKVPLAEHGLLLAS